MEYIRIGKIVNTHGIRGEVKIYSYSDFDDQRYKKGNVVYLLHEGNYIPLTVHSYREHKGMALVSFEQLQDINLVEKYKNDNLYIDRDSREPLEEGEYYRDELENLDAYDQDGNALGTTLGIEETNGAQNNLRIRMENGKEFLVPYIPEFIEEVDLEENKIVIKMQEGLL